MKPADFFVTYKDAAIHAAKTTGIPASINLAQAALESGWGQYAPGFNFFGIKANAEWKGEKQLIPTTEVLPYATPAELKEKTGIVFPEVIQDKSPDGKTTTDRIVPYPGRKGFFIWHIMDYFRKYTSATESFQDHDNFFIVNKNYAQALKDEKLPERFAIDIAIARYATAPNYGQMLIDIIKQYGLTQYDTM
jgi:flagellum-specific peptidoglycan hydrolase FlgJ